jgi:hypothetical protein
MIPRCVRTVARVARTASLAAVALMFSASMLAAQASGKIEGRIRDNAGAPIANAQVFIVGTTYSALSNAQGYYFINNIPVGAVDMRAAFVGYRPVLVRGVLVRGGQTGTQDFALEASVVEVQAIEVTAERPLVPRDQVTSKPIVSGDMASALPADRISAVLALQPGVVASSGSNPSLSIRGGRSEENITYVDGVPVQAGNRGGAARGVGSSTLAVSTNSFQEATITTGASAAEFGNAQAGVIAIETRTGGSRFQGNIGYETDEFLGATRNNSLGFNRFQLGVGGPIAQNLTFSLNGALEGQKSAATGKGIETPLYTPVGVDTVVAVPITSDDNPLVDTAYVAVANFAVFQGDCDEISSANSDITGNYGIDCQGVRIPRSGTSNYSVAGKLNYTFGAGNRLTFSVNRSQNQGRNQAYTSQLNPASATGFWNANNVFTGSANFNLTRSAERALALETYISYQTDRVLGGPLTAQSELDSRDPTMGFMVSPLEMRFNFDNFELNEELVENFSKDIDGSRRSPYDLEDTDQYNTINDQYRASPYGTFGWATSGGPGGTLSMYRENRLVGRAALDWQADRFNRVRIGGDFTTYDMFYYVHGLVSQAFADVWHEKPRRASAFVSDRLDLGDVVVDLGLRYDWYKTGASRPHLLDTVLTSSTYGEYVYFPRPNSYGVGVDSMVTFIEDSAHTYLSPHLQVAFPVTQRTNFRLSYAHQVQAPDFGTMLTGINTDLANTNTNHNFGSDLDFGRTITFEFGVRHEFSPDMVLDVSAYNKDKLADASGRLVPVFDLARNNPSSIRLQTSADFGNVRGVDVQLMRRIGNLFTGQMSYTYQDARSTGSDPYTYINFGSRIVDQLSGGNAQPPQAILPMANSRTHTLAGVASINFPDGWNQGTAVGSILENVGLNATFRVASGTPYTACPNNSQNAGNIAFDGNGGAACSGSQADQASDQNGVRLPTFRQFDLRLTKGLAIRGVDLLAYVDARNVLNLTNVLQVFQGTRDVRNEFDSEEAVSGDMSSWRTEATANAKYNTGTGAIDLRFNGAGTGGCGSWVNQGNDPNAVNCVYLIRAEERFGDGDGIFSAAEQRRASLAEYLVGRGLDSFYGAPRRVRVGFEVSF